MTLGEILAERAAEVQRRHPTLPPGKAFELALADDPQLAARHHRGDDLEPDPPAPPAEPTYTDPGQLLMTCIAARIALGATREEAQRATFAQHPELAEAWNRGQLIPKAPTGGRVGPPAEIVSFRSAMAGSVAGNTLIGVEIFRPGTWNGTKYDSKSIDELAKSFDQLGYRPPVTLGHNAPDDALAHGYVSRVYRVGDVLLADIAGVPAETIQSIRDGRILSVSAEIYIGLKRGDKTFPYALRALSLLGAHPPGVDLKPLVEALPPI